MRYSEFYNRSCSLGVKANRAAGHKSAAALGIGILYRTAKHIRQAAQMLSVYISVSCERARKHICILSKKSADNRYSDLFYHAPGKLSSEICHIESRVC